MTHQLTYVKIMIGYRIDNHIISSKAFYDGYEQESMRSKFVGSILCLDFLDTIAGRRAAKPRELLSTYADFISWARRVDVVSEEQAKLLAGESESHPEAAVSALASILETRELLLWIFSLAAAGDFISNGDIAKFNILFSRYMSFSCIQRQAGRFQIGFVERDSSWTGLSAM